MMHRLNTKMLVQVCLAMEARLEQFFTKYFSREHYVTFFRCVHFRIFLENKKVTSTKLTGMQKRWSWIKTLKLQKGWSAECKLNPIIPRLWNVNLCDLACDNLANMLFCDLWFLHTINWHYVNNILKNVTFKYEVLTEQGHVKDWINHKKARMIKGSVYTWY